MIAISQQQDPAVEHFASIARDRINGDGRFVRALREAGLEAFEKSGFPTTKWEDWRFTNVAALAQTPFELPGAARDVSAKQLDAFAVPGLSCSTLVFIDGRYAPDLSQIHPLPPGARITHLADVLGEKAVHARLGKLAIVDGQPFAALNAAMLGEGVFIEVGEGVDIEEPIHLLNVATTAAGDRPVMTHPRNLVIVGAGGQVKIIEHYVALGDGVYLTNAVTEVFAGDKAYLAHYLIEEESMAAYNVSALHAKIGAAASLESHAILLDGALVRNIVHPIMAGEKGHCLVNGLFVGEGRQHLDNYMRVEHRAPNCESHQYYNGILNGHARGVFTGRIVVDRIAQKTDAKQTSANLLLSDDAQIDTMPQLEIYADDVKCTHGATIGQIDEDALFYLRTRGISRDAARAMMVYAFAAETFERMKLVEPIQAMLTKKLLQRLPEGAFLETVL